MRAARLVLALVVATVATVAIVACARSVVDDPGPEPGLGTPDGCAGLSCKRVSCSAGTATRLRGRVLDPAGVRGLYGVSVYVPNGAIAPLAHGATCKPCAGRRVDAAASALTDVRGEFVLDDVPVDARVPVVVELGSWRRVAEISVTPCTDTRIDDDRTRLPRSSLEGELPLTAVTTGAADALECLLRNVGIADEEFVAAGDDRGRVHMYRGKGGGGRRGAFVTDAADLWNDAKRLAPYDIVVLSCEGTEALENKGGDAPSARGAMASYAKAGGHVFATHLHSAWLQRSPDEDFRSVASWTAPADVGDEYGVDTSFPKGDAFAAWLLEARASTTRGRIVLDNVTASAGAVRGGVAHGWIRQAVDRTRYFSFNTPVGAGRDSACGRVVYGDLHAFGLGGSDFPDGCPGDRNALTPQQLALEFLLFDAFACVDDDALPPTPPR